MSKKYPPEVSDLITESLLSGQMTKEESDDLCANCPEESDCYQWHEKGIHHRKWNSGYREYSSEATGWKWKPYKSDTTA